MQRVRRATRCGKRRRREAWVTVATVVEEMRAALLRVRLAGARVRCRVPTGSQDAPYGYGARRHMAFAVQVPSSQEDLARRILADDAADTGDAPPTWATYSRRRASIQSPSVLSTGSLLAFWIVVAAAMLAGLTYLCEFVAKSL